MKTCATCNRLFSTDIDFLMNTKQWRICEYKNLWFNCLCGSTLMLPKGKYPWYDPKKAMSQEAQSVFNKISHIDELPHIPQAVMKVQELLNYPETETSDLVSAIKKDPFLGTEVIKVAENLRNARSQERIPMKSLDFAINYIGKKALGEITLAASIKTFKLPTNIFQDQNFWKHNMLSACIAESLAGKFLSHKEEKDKAYLAACLANIGKIVGAICFSEKTDQISNHIMNPKTAMTWEDGEKKFQMFSHCTLGEIGGVLWGLPPFITDAIREHHAKINKINLNAIVGFSTLLAHWVMLEPSRIDSSLLAHYQEVFGVSEQIIESWISQEFLIFSKSISF